MNTAIFGLVGDIGVIAEKFRWMGPGRYDAVAVWGLLKGFKQHVLIDVIDEDGKEIHLDEHLLTVVVNHTQHFGKEAKHLRWQPGGREVKFTVDYTHLCCNHEPEKPAELFAAVFRVGEQLIQNIAIVFYCGWM